MMVETVRYCSETNDTISKPIRYYLENKTAHAY